MSGPGEGTEYALGVQRVDVSDERSRVVEDYEDQDDPKAFHVSRGRPTAIILPFPIKR